MHHTKIYLIFGEVLIDAFDSGHERRGGAPFNVAWHLKGFNQKPFFVSRVGRDQYGKQLLEDMKNWEMDTRGVQSDAHKPTGYVSVLNSETDPTYEIHTGVAYDFIESLPGPLTRRDEDLTVIYHGSLALRSEKSKNTLDGIIKRFPRTPVFFDVNLRSPWWEIDNVRENLHKASYLKCNESELMILGERIFSGQLDPVSTAEQFINAFTLQMVIVTRGEKGAFIFDRQNFLYEATPVSVKYFSNSVGAGDAFSAVMMMGLTLGWDLETVLQRATQFAAAICGIDGAVPNKKKLYQNYLNEWR